MTNLNGKVHHEPAPHWELRFVDSREAAFKATWPRVRKGIEQIIEEGQGFFKLIPEEVYVSLWRRWSFLYLAVVDGVVEGWGILATKKDDITQEPYLLYWLGQSDTTEAKELWFKDLERIAREKQYKSIRIYSARMGWIRKLPGPGWRVAEICLEKRLD